jgi:tetratricopeptide (TPR) repeat protein
LFLSVGRRVKPEFDLTADNLPHVVHICHLLRGMPLAIVLAASWIRMLTPAEIERELAPDLDAQESGHGLDFLAADLHDVPARQRSIRAVFDRSWRLLTARECGVMEALSVFRGGCTREAAQEVAGASLRDLGSLVDRSLLQRDAPSRDGRFEMHELLRQYAAEKLAASPDAGWAVRDRHSAYYLAALRKWEGALKDARQQATLAEMDAEVDNVRAAWEWAVGRGRIEPLERAAAGLSLYCELRSRDPEGEAAFRATADRLEGMYGAGGTGPVEKVPVVGLRALARMRMWQGVSACQWHLTAIAERSLRQSLELLDRPELAACDMRLERGILLYTLGHLGFDAGREDTVQRFEESLALFRALDNRWWAGRALYFLAILAMDAAEYAGARQQFEEALTLFRAQGDLHWSANVSIMASAIYYKMGQIEQGEPLAREGLALMQALGDRAGTALGLENLACFACRAGEYAEFDALMERCLALWDDLGTRRTTVMWHVGEAKMHLGQYECARTLVQQEIDLLQERGQQREACYNVIMIGMVALAEGAYEETHRSLKKSISMCQEFRLSGFLADAEAAMGYAARGIGRPDQAREHLAEALRLGRKQDSWPPVVLALPAIALLLADRGAAEQAVELYALATIFPYVANSRWFEDVAGKHIAAAAALPPQVVAAAQERGRARDLWATVEELLAELEMDS